MTKFQKFYGTEDPSATERLLSSLKRVRPRCLTFAAGAYFPPELLVKAGDCFEFIDDSFSVHIRGSTTENAKDFLLILQKVPTKNKN